MFRLSTLILILIGLVLLQSCDTLQKVTTTKFEILIPGKIIIPHKYKNAVIRYNNCNVAENANFSSYSEDNKVLSDTTNIDSIASEVYFRVFVDYLKSQQFFDTIYELKPMNYSDIEINDSLVYAKYEIHNSTDSFQAIQSNSEVFNFTRLVRGFTDSDSKKPKTKFMDAEFGLYTKAEIQQIADSTQADLLFSFDWFASEDGIFSPYYKVNFTDTISTKNTNSFNFRTATEAVSILSYWNFYDLQKQELIFSQLKTDTIRWFEPTYSLKEAKRALPPRKDAVLNAADVAASRLVEFFVPHWIEVERMYYRSGHVELKKTDELIKQNRWLDAAEIWKKNTTNKNKSITAKSMYNMALACEMNGDMNAAIDWAVKSFQVFGSKNQFHAANCQDYIKILAQRKLDIKTIESKH